MSDDSIDEDFDDFDDELADDSWDEFDDDETTDEVNKKTSSEAAVAHKKSFVQKNFYPIVIGVCVIGAAIVGTGQFIKPDTDTLATKNSILPTPDDAPVGQFDMTNSDTEADEISELSEESNLPPMPTPMNTEDIFDSPNDFETTDFNIENAKEMTEPEFEISEDNALTPLPGNLSANPEDLEELDVEELKTTAVNDNALLAAERGNVNILGDIPVLEEKSIKPTEKAPEKAAPAENKEVENIDASPSSENKMTALELELSNYNNELSEKISEKDGKIKALEQSINALEEKIAQLERAQAEKAPEPPKEKIIAPATKTTSETTAKPTPKPEEKSVSVSKTKKITATTWIMRSAQPGKALISAQGTGDVRSVEVGDTVSGIGRILSIAPENNKWVIRGSRGTITQ